ncbi:MAG: M13 family metallopeptidase, partial [Iodobacter sp.]
MKQKFALSVIAATLAFGAQAAVVSGLDTRHFDQNVRVQDDLYQAVNGLWLKSVEIPADQSSYGTFLILRDLAESQVRTIVEAAASQNGLPGSAVKKVGDFYQSYMNEAAVEQQGLTSLQPTLAAINGLKNTTELVAELGRLSLLGVSTPLETDIGQDQKNSTQYIVYLSQSGLSLPDRDYYLKSEAKFIAAREALAVYYAQMLKLSGEKDVDVAALMALETELAKAQWSQVDNRDPQKTYNKKSLLELKAMAPAFDWNAYTDAMGISAHTGALIISQPSYMQAMSRIVANTPLATWQTWLKFKVLDRYASVLPKAYVDLAFDFHGKALSGVPEQKPRWKRAIAATNGHLGEAVGELYVDKYFTAASKAKMDSMVNNLLAAYKLSINNLSWMSPATKLKAQQKLAKFTVKIGYPEEWIDYSSLEIKPDDLLGNILRARVFAVNREINKLGKPINR